MKSVETLKRECNSRLLEIESRIRVLELEVKSTKKSNLKLKKLLELKDALRESEDIACKLKSNKDPQEHISKKFMKLR